MDGSDVKTLISTNSGKSHNGLGVLCSNIYYTDDNQLIMRNKAQISTPFVLYTATNRIDSIYVFKSTCNLCK